MIDNKKDLSDKAAECPDTVSISESRIGRISLKKNVYTKHFRSERKIYIEFTVER